MSIAALYDIHGNLPALEAVMRDVRAAGAREIVVGGDVFPGPMALEALEYLLACDLPTSFLAGNGERELLACIAGQPSGVPEAVRPVMEWCAHQCQPHHTAALSSWPATLQRDVPGIGPVLFCHATPHTDTQIVTAHTPHAEMQRHFGGTGASLIVCGHTHMQFDRTLHGTRVVNAGSVGMPVGEPGAYWLLLDHDVHLRHTSYDVAAAAQRIRATHDPERERCAEHLLLRPPTAEAMLTVILPTHPAPRTPDS